MRNALLILLAMGLVIIPVAGQAQGPTETDLLSENVISDLEALAERIETTGEVPGFVLWINSPSQTYELSVGYANLEDETPISAEQTFRIGSITKTFTATVVLQLVEEGLIDLDTSIDTYLPSRISENVPNSDIITVRQLLNHRAGTMNYTDFFADFTSFDNAMEILSQDLSPEEVLEAYYYGNEPLFEPGTSWSYSNTNYLLLGMLIEGVTEDALENQYRQRILEPLGMDSTYLGDSETPQSELITNYTPTPDGEGWLEVTDDNLNAKFAWSAGAMVSNAEDLALFARALFNGDLFEDDATLDEMLTLANEFYGLGVVEVDENGVSAYGHDGNIPAFASMWAYVPDYDVVIVSWINTDAGSVSGIVSPILIGLSEAE